MVGKGDTFDGDALTVLDPWDVPPTAKNDGGIAGAIIDHDLDGLNTGTWLNAHALNLATDFHSLTGNDCSDFGKMEIFEAINESFGVDFSTVDS